MYTSDVNGAGTDADVFIVLYGREVVTSQKSLCDNKKKRKEGFEKNSIDKFVVEVSKEMTIFGQRSHESILIDMKYKNK